MIVCEECKRKRFKKVLEDADRAAERFYKKIRGKNGTSKQNRKNKRV